MNVLLLGEHGDQLDEGIKNTSIKLHDAIGADEVTLLDLRTVDSVAFWRRIRSLDPDVVHLIPGPTPQGLVLLRLIGAWTGAKTVATATQPLGVDRMKQGSAVLAPDRLVAQSAAVEREFDAAGFDTAFVPSGVDLDRYAPQSNGDELRAALDLPQDGRLFLHVGHCKEGRNVRALTHLTEYGDVVVVGSPSTGPQDGVVSELRSAGCIVRTEYIDRIERYYNAADVYVFPTTDDGNSIQAPLSVFEAMGCNLPVIATEFGGLTDCFEAGDGLRFVDDVRSVTEADLEFETVDTRSKVEPYAWSSIGEQVTDVYESV